MAPIGETLMHQVILPRRAALPLLLALGIALVG